MGPSDLDATLNEQFGEAGTPPADAVAPATAAVPADVTGGPAVGGTPPAAVVPPVVPGAGSEVPIAPAVTPEPSTSTAAVPGTTEGNTGGPLRETSALPSAPVIPANIPRRVNLGRMSELSQVSLAIMDHNPDMLPSQAEALAREHLGMPLAGQAAEGNTGGTPALPSPSPAEALAEKRTGLETQFKEAMRNGFTDVAADLQVQLSDVIADQKVVEFREEQRQQAEVGAADAAWDTAAAESLSRAKGLHPDVINAESPLGQEIARVIDALAGDPVMDSPMRSETIALMAMRNLGIAPVVGQGAAAGVTPAVVPGQAAVVQQPVQQQQTQPLQVPPILPGSGVSAAPVALTEAQVNVAMESMSVQDLDKLLYGDRAAMPLMLR